MSKTLRRVFILLPCTPGMTLLLAGAALAVLRREDPDVERVWELLAAGVLVTLGGLVVGAFVAWRIAHPQPDVEEEEDPPPST